MTYFRDTEICARMTNVPRGSESETFTDPSTGYCCYLDTMTSSTSRLLIKRAGGTFAKSEPFPTVFGDSAYHTLQLSVIGNTISCGHVSENTEAVTTWLRASDHDSVLAEGGLAFLVYDGSSSHYFRSFSL